MPRYSMLETIREFGWEQLTIHEERHRIQQLHASHFTCIFEQEFQRHLRGASVASLLARGAAELDNVRAALGWATEHDVDTALRLTWAFSMYWMTRGPQIEGRSCLEAALASDQSSSTARATALFCAGFFAMTLGDHAAGRRHTEEGLALFRDLGDACGVAECLYGLARSALFTADFELAERLFEESISLFRECDVFWLVAALGNLGVTLIARREYARADAVLVEGLALSKQGAVATDQVAYYLYLRGLIALNVGDLSSARDLLIESLTILRALRDIRHCVHGLEISAWLAAARREPERTARLLGAASSLRESLGMPIPRAFQIQYDRFVPLARAQVAAAVWQQAWAEGRTLALDDAIEYALQEEPNPVAAGMAATARLSPREHEVLLLIASGKSNREIAAALFLSERTVERHIENLYRKFNVHNRADAVEAAQRNLLI
jgi:non-specific serine/threonine protein kinase